MGKKVFLALVLACLFAGALSSVYVKVLEPIQATVSPDQTIVLGNAGPGQTIVLLVDRGTEGNPIDPRCADNYCTTGWDRVVPIENTVPVGWEVEPSLLLESPMRVKVKISPFASDGEYNLSFAAVDEGNYDALENVTFHAVVTVTRDVFSIDVWPKNVQTGVGQPAIYYVNITNTGVASDPFEIRVREGSLPAPSFIFKREGGWNFRKQVLVNYQSTRVVPYEVVLDEEATRDFTLEVYSVASPTIRQDVTLTIKANSDILNDWRATTHGLMIFPILLEPAYAIMGIIGNLIPG